MAEVDHQGVVQQAYDGRAPAYLDSSVHAHGADLELISARIGQQPQATVLDLGCGSGHVGLRLAAQVGQVVACDLSGQMLASVVAEAARRGLINLTTRQEAAETLSFESATFDAVVTRYSAHHWQDQAAGIRQIQRVLKPGGLAIVADTIAPESALHDTWLQSIELLRDPAHVRNARLSEWASLLGQAGLLIERIVTDRLRLDFEPWIARTQTPALPVAAMRALQQAAARELRAYFEITEDGSFTLDTAVFVARKPL